MSRQTHREWYSQVTDLRAELGAEPDNLELASRLWDLLSGSTGFDVRSGRLVIETFRHSALKSDEGVTALVSELRKIANDTGELPSAALFDPVLENLLRSVSRQSNHPCTDDILWILDTIEQ